MTPAGIFKAQKDSGGIPPYEDPIKILTILVQRFLLVIVIWDFLFKKPAYIKFHLIRFQILIASRFREAREKEIFKVC